MAGRRKNRNKDTRFDSLWTVAFGETVGYRRELLRMEGSTDQAPVLEFAARHYIGAAAARYAAQYGGASEDYFDMIEQATAESRFGASLPLED